MSDTKALIKYARDRLNDGPNLTFGKPTVCDLVEALESAEANVARLNKMVDWLADKLETAISCPRGDMELECPFDTSPGSETCATIMDSIPSGEVWGHCWKEAARKAVDAGEGKE